MKLISNMMKEKGIMTKETVRTLIVSCVPERGKLIADIIAEEIPIEVVAETSDGDEALRLFAERKPELVLTCITLKGLSGLELTRAIKAIDSSAKVVITSIRSDLQAEVSRTNPDGFVLLPPSPSELISTVLEVLNK